MALVICGIDEAGYGPMLGPLVVARAVLAIEDWSPGQPAPDIWKVLEAGVCQKPNDKRGRVAIADSKKLKRPNDSAEPLEHLLRGVLAMLGTCRDEPIETDLHLLSALGVEVDSSRSGQVWPAWYAFDQAGRELPGVQATRLATNVLAGVMRDAGVRLLDLRVEVIDVVRFNSIVREAGTKAATTGAGLATHLGAMWTRFASPSRGDGAMAWGGTKVAGEGGGPRVVCDRQGGRTDYGPSLYDWLPMVARAAKANAGGVTEIERSEERCRYEVVVESPPQDAGAMHVLFQPEGETHHLPIALASMAAKLTRELMMARFNAYWSAKAAAAGITLKPTAGYVQDARRWLTDAKGLLSARDREALIRRA
jgi:ribonuclease HII